MKTRHTSRSLWLTLLLVFCASLFIAPVVLADIVTGVVVDCHGNAIDGATVALFKVDGTNEVRQGTQTTNGHGVFEFQASKGTYNVFVVCPGGSSSHSVNFSIPGSAAGMLRLVCDCPKTSGSSTVATNNGLTKLTFETPSGQVVLYLPADIASGDTISGTVTEEPKGKTAEEKEKNKSVLEGLVIDLGDGTKVSADKPRFTWTPVFPPAPARPRYELKITPVFPNGEPAGEPAKLSFVFRAPRVGQGSMGPSRYMTWDEGIERSDAARKPAPTDSPEPTTIPKYIIPGLGQAGRPIIIIGPFDGDSANTGVTFHPLDPSGTLPTRTIQVIAESPRKAVVAVPPDVVGQTQVQVHENGSQTTGTLRSVGVNLTAPKTSLLKGESTELHVEVNGLQGITKPVPLTLESHGAITMVGGMYQQLTIEPAQVSADGRYTTTRGVSGVQTGGWGTTVTVVTQPFNFCLQDDNNGGSLWLNSFTGAYMFAPPAGPYSERIERLFGESPAMGNVTVKNGMIHLEQNDNTRRVVVDTDRLAGRGSATIELRQMNQKFTITDRNTADKTCACGPGCK